MGGTKPSAPTSPLGVSNIVYYQLRQFQVKQLRRSRDQTTGECFRTQPEDLVLQFVRVFPLIYYQFNFILLDNVPADEARCLRAS